MGHFHAARTTKGSLARFRREAASPTGQTGRFAATFPRMVQGLAIRVLDTESQAFEDQTFVRFPIRIGRDKLNDLCVSSPYVSGFHGVIERNGAQLLLRDLGSTNGTVLGSASWWLLRCGCGALVCCLRARCWGTPVGTPTGGRWHPRRRPRFDGGGRASCYSGSQF